MKKSIFNTAFVCFTLIACAQADTLNSVSDQSDSESDETQVALNTAARDLEEVGRIRSGFERLGMSAEGSECYAARIDGMLDGERLHRAAEIVAAAESSDDVRQGVMGGGQDLQAAFVSARFGCSMVN